MLQKKTFFLFVTSVCSQTDQETGQFALLKWLHPMSANDSQAAFPSLLPRVGFTTRLWGSPLTPGAVFSKSQLALKKQKKQKKRLQWELTPSLPPALHPPTAPRTMAYSPTPVLHYRACGLAVQQASDFNHMYCTQIKRVSPGSMAA